MQYDIALKTLLETAREDFFRAIIGENVLEFKGIEELPTETVSVRRSDFPVRVKDENGEEMIHLVEFESHWNADKLWSMLGYKARYVEKYGLPVKSTMVLLTKSNVAVNVLEEREITFRFNLVKMWELPAKEFLSQEHLLPLIPLMDGGVDLTIEAERLIYESNAPEKFDKLTILAILTSMRDMDVFRELLRRRRDIMVQSPGYEWIVAEGFEKGMQKGWQEGRQEGELRKALDTSRIMLSRNMELSLILEITGLTESQLREHGIIP